MSSNFISFARFFLVRFGKPKVAKLEKILCRLFSCRQILIESFIVATLATSHGKVLTSKLSRYESINWHTTEEVSTFHLYPSNEQHQRRIGDNSTSDRRNNKIPQEQSITRLTPLRELFS